MRLSPVERTRVRIGRAWEEGAPVPGLAGWGLLPASALYRLGTALYHGAYRYGLLRPVDLGVPTVSVGNATVGGAGKTPVTRWVVERLLERGRNPAVLHGGYHEDEPRLHARWYPQIPTIAERDRRKGAVLAIQAGADTLVLDDAFQHRRVARDLDLVLVAAEGWSSRPLLLPRGPWREPPRSLRRADLICVTRKTASPERSDNVAGALRNIVPGVPVARLFLAPAGWLDGAGNARQGSPQGAVLAVAGVAGPASFFAQAGDAGAQVVDTVALPDHHDYGADGVEALLERAGDRPLVTTAKDAVKLGSRVDPDRLWVLDQRLVVEAGGERVERALDGLLS